MSEGPDQSGSEWLISIKVWQGNECERSDSVILSAAAILLCEVVNFVTLRSNMGPKSRGKVAVRIGTVLGVVTLLTAGVHGQMGT